MTEVCLLPKAASPYSAEETPSIPQPGAARESPPAVFAAAGPGLRGRTGSGAPHPADSARPGPARPAAPAVLTLQSWSRSRRIHPERGSAGSARASSSASSPANGAQGSGRSGRGPTSDRSERLPAARQTRRGSSPVRRCPRGLRAGGREAAGARSERSELRRALPGIGMCPAGTAPARAARTRRAPAQEIGRAHV